MKVALLQSLTEQKPRKKKLCGPLLRTEKHQGDSYE